MFKDCTHISQTNREKQGFTVNMSDCWSRPKFNWVLFIFLHLNQAFDNYSVIYLISNYWFPEPIFRLLSNQNVSPVN